MKLIKMYAANSKILRDHAASPDAANFLAWYSHSAMHLFANHFSY